MHKESSGAAAAATAGSFGNELREALGRAGAISAAPSKGMYAPLLIIALLAFGRLVPFERQNWNAPILIVFGALFLLLLWEGLLLRHRAEKIRSLLLRRLSDRQIELASTGRYSSDAERDHKLWKAEIEGYAEGSFRHWSQEPVIRALAIPFGGMGAFALLDAMKVFGI